MATNAQNGLISKTLAVSAAQLALIAAAQDLSAFAASSNSPQHKAEADAVIAAVTPCKAKFDALALTDGEILAND